MKNDASWLLLHLLFEHLFQSCRYMLRCLSQSSAGPAVQRIDFNKLDTVALKRYRRFHQLDDIGPNPTKEELVTAVGRHFNAQVNPLNPLPLARCPCLSKLAALGPLPLALCPRPVPLVLRLGRPSSTLNH